VTCNITPGLIGQINVLGEINVVGIIMAQGCHTSTIHAQCPTLITIGAPVKAVETLSFLRIHYIWWRVSFLFPGQ